MSLMPGYRPWGEAMCSYLDGECQNAATIHARIDPDSIASCDDHASEMPAADDQHPFGGACNMPGAWWVFSRDGEPGRCEMPNEVDALTAHAVLEDAR